MWYTVAVSSQILITPVQMQKSKLKIFKLLYIFLISVVKYFEPQPKHSLQEEKPTHPYMSWKYLSPQQEGLGDSLGFVTEVLAC